MPRNKAGDLSGLGFDPFAVFGEWSSKADRRGYPLRPVLLIHCRNRLCRC
jgi:hypothetical protein